jgi:hypothetical protein
MKSRLALLALGIGLSVLVPAALAASLDVSYTIDGVSGTNGWYRGSSGGNYIVIHWHVSDPNATTQGCELGLKIPGPTTGTTSTCTAQSGSETASKSVTVKIDADPPTGVAASLSRGPDFHGWYNHPVGISWSGSDATSGIAGCSSVIYGGPDGGGASVGGACTDKAGNSAWTAFTLNYDATPPALSKLSVASGADADVVHWSSSSPADRIVVQRAARGSKAAKTVFDGSAPSFADKRIHSGLEYVYWVQAFDQAGNASQKVSVAGLPKVLTLRKTPYIPRAAKKPILRWAAVRGASYYHVQLFRGSKRILALWPSKHEVGLPATWKWAGKRYRLGPGTYRWYVWAGLGKRSFANYKTLGNAQFIVPRR